jgi:hypothetical protein
MFSAGCWVLDITKRNRYPYKWLTDETFFRAINKKFPTLALGDSLSSFSNRGLMNRANYVCGGTQLDDVSESNQSGISCLKGKGISLGQPQKTHTMGILCTKTRTTCSGTIEDEFLVSTTRQYHPLWIPCGLLSAQSCRFDFRNNCETCCIQAHSRNPTFLSGCIKAKRQGMVQYQENWWS